MNASTILHIEQGRDMALSSAISLIAALGLGLDWLLSEPECEVCDGMPPAGFICGRCGLEGKTGSDEEGGKP